MSTPKIFEAAYSAHSILANASAYERLTAHARNNGWTVRGIDDDCTILSHPRWLDVQVTFDNYSDSWKFVAACTVANGHTFEVFRSYQGVRKYITGKAEIEAQERADAYDRGRSAERDAHEERQERLAEA